MDKVTCAPEYQWLLKAAVGCALCGCAQGVATHVVDTTEQPPLTAAPTSVGPTRIGMGAPNASLPPSAVAGSFASAPSVSSTPPVAGRTAAPVAGAVGILPAAPPGALMPDAPQPPPPTSDASCPDASKARKAGRYVETLATRSYALQIPAGYDGSRPLALVFDYHTFNGNSEVQAGYSGWRAKGDAAGFIVVEPQGIANAWNGGSCCSRATSDDIAFTKSIAAKVGQEFCVDRKRIYATGLANGGAMSHRLACEAADFIAASAPVSMGGLTTCSPARPITVAMFRGRNDPTVPYNGGRFRGAEADFSAWAKVNGCTGEPLAQSPKLAGVSDPADGCRTYAECKGGAAVTLCSPPAAHVLYTDAAPAAQVADIAWAIFEAHPMP